MNTVYGIGKNNRGGYVHQCCYRKYYRENGIPVGSIEDVIPCEAEKPQGKCSICGRSLLNSPVKSY